MQEVTQKINEMYSLLETKVVAYEKKFQMASQLQADLEEKGRIASAKEKRLSAMERIYKKYEDLDNEKKLFEVAKKDYAGEMARLERKIHEDTVILQEIKDEQVKLDTRKKVLNKQATALKERETEFDSKKEDLKSMISGKAIKDLLK